MYILVLIYAYAIEVPGHVMGRCYGQVRGI